MTAVNWAAYQHCPQCFAPLGEPCTELFKVIVGTAPLKTEATAPHSGRKLRAGYGR